MVVRSEDAEQLGGWAKGVVKVRMGTAAVGDEVKDVVVVADAERVIPVLWILLRLLLLWTRILVKGGRQ